MTAKIEIRYRPFEGYLWSLQRDNVVIEPGKCIPPERADQVLQEYGLALAPRPPKGSAWRIEIEVSNDE